MPGTAVVTINENQWTTEVASTQAELMTGLAGRTSLTPGAGMLFILPSAQQVTVTTQDILFPIDIIFIANNTVLDVASDIQPGYEVTEETPCDMFLEVNAGEAAGVSQGDTVTVEYLYSIVGDINAWIPPMISLVGLGIIGGFLTGMMRTMTKAVLGESKKSQPKLLPQAKKTLKAKWYDRGVEVGKTDAWMDVENTLKETARAYPKIKDAYELVWTDIELWEQTDHFNILYGSKMWEDVKGDIDLYFDLKSEFWEGYLAGRKEIGRDIYKIAEELVKSSSMELLPQTAGHRGKVSYIPKALRLATESKEVLTRTVRDWLRKGKAHSIQNAGWYGAEGFKPRLFVVDDTIYQVDWGVYRSKLMPASESDLAKETKRRLREKGIELETLSSEELSRPTRYDVSVDSWVERDRIGIWITDLRTSKTIAEWWDDEARAMFDEGFFKPATFTRSGELGGREFIESVLDYAESVGLLAKEGSVKYLPQTEKGKFSWLIIDPETGEIMIKTGYDTVTKAKRSAREFAIRRAKYAGEHSVKLRIYDRDPNIGNLEVGVVFEGQILLPGGEIIETSSGQLPDQWETRAVVLEDTLTGMPGFQDKLSHLEDWLTNVEREVFPTRELVKRTIERFPERFGITKGNVVYIKFARFPTTEQPPALIPVEPRKRKERDLEYLADSPEFLTQTIDDTGYRGKLDATFQEAIARAKGLR